MTLPTPETVLTPEKKNLALAKYLIDSIVDITSQLKKIEPDNQFWGSMTDLFSEVSKTRGKELKETVKLENDSKKEAKEKKKWADTFKKVVEHYKGAMK